MRNSLGQYKITDQGQGKVIVSMKGGTPTFVDPVDEENRDIRIKGFSGSGHLSSVLKNVIDLGYREVKRPSLPVNLFVEDNALTLCTARRDEKGKIVKEYDYLVMKVANGTLDPETVTATYDTESRTFMLTQEGEVIIGGRASADDQLYACIFESTKEHVMLQELRTRGESGSTVISLPKGWDAEAIFIYVFVNSTRERLSSPSTRAYPAPTEAELLEARLVELQKEELERKRVAALDTVIDRKQRVVEAMLSARETSFKAREDAIAAGKTPREARQEETRVYDELMEAFHATETEEDDAQIEAEERTAIEKREREEKARQKAKERRRAIATRVAAEREEERELRHLEKEEKKKRLEELKKS